ncbi:MAG: DNA polymerase-3 subunit delta [Myxococcota bacterium]|jgi:DNA polymerase-3 subunit delta
MSLAQLKKSLGQDGLKPVYLLVGDARPLIDRAVQQVTAAVMPSVGVAAFNVTTCRCGEDDPTHALTTARTLPMMAERRLVVIRDAHEASDAFWAALVTYLERPPESTALVITAEKLKAREKARSKLLDSAEKRSAILGRVVTLATRSVRPESFAIEVAERLGKRLSSRSASVLIAVIGADLSRIEREVEKISVFVGEAAEITDADIEAAGSALSEAAIWDLTAGVAAGDRDQALTSLHRLLRSGNDPRRLLAMLLWQVRELLVARELLLRGADDRAVTRGTKVRIDVLRRARARIQTDAFEPGTVYTRLRDAHFAMNGHRAGAERVLEALVFDLMARGTH